MSQLRVEYHRKFEKQLAKLPLNQRNKVIDAIELFLNNPTHPQLNSHALRGEWKGIVLLMLVETYESYFKL